MELYEYARPALFAGKKICGACREKIAKLDLPD